MSLLKLLTYVTHDHTATLEVTYGLEETVLFPCKTLETWPCEDNCSGS